MAKAARPAEATLEGDNLQRCKEDLVWLVCPVCKSALQCVESVSGPSWHIQCSGCERCYPVVDGLPILLADRAVPTSATKVPAS